MHVIIKLKPFLCFLFVSPAAGLLPFLIAPRLLERYENGIQPVLRYPLGVFLILWFGMLVLLGTAGYLVYQTKSRSKPGALKAGGTMLSALLLWGLFVFGLDLPLVGLVLMVFGAVCALKFAAESLWMSKAAFLLGGAEFLWMVYLAANSFFLWRM